MSCLLLRVEPEIVVRKQSKLGEGRLGRGVAGLRMIAGVAHDQVK